MVGEEVVERAALPHRHAHAKSAKAWRGLCALVYVCFIGRVEGQDPICLVYLTLFRLTSQTQDDLVGMRR